MEIIRMTVRGRDADETNAQSQRTDKKAKVRIAAYIRVSNESDTSDESYERMHVQSRVGFLNRYGYSIRNETF